ncbi:long-chain fatty acid--CoA ligase [Sinimarinibacterium sp. CAU 1509]|uniref:AMP-binding protein n=1 Tax=Sinimarinibacterium sp. CAU 1509 TaxID=2562283 RepID=UPI0010AB8F3C|nr:AMP-binding protein [Sinimarinibacterium sp. CAU 1509]TJY65211.1 long-chain fatty acid--CoA ligase [Sinimarinibacterium sp. CAU 1509]
MSLKNPVEMLLHWAQERPNQTWLHQPVDGVWKKYSWAECDAQVRSMATALRQLGLPDGARIAISGRNTAHWFMADLAIAMAGYVSVGLYPKQAADAVRYILEHSETKALFVGPMPDVDEFMGALPQGITTIGFPYADVPGCDKQWDDLVRASEPFAGYQAPDPDSLHTLIYTSGTTGHPKGVMITGANMMFATQGLLKTMPAQGQERFFSYLPLAHAFERGALELASLYLGAEVFFLENLDKLAEQLKEVAPTRFFGVPLVYNRIQAGILKKMPQAKLDRLLRIPVLSTYVKKKIRQGAGLQNARYLFVGAAPMPIPLMQWFEKVGITVLQGYGMTENNIYATANLPGANRIGSVGRAMPGADMRIADDGEIQYKHPAVTPGYYKDPEKTAELFTADSWLRTGDKGRIDEDGYLYITGRTKDIFKTLKGKYVAPAPIEGALSRNTDIDQLCFVGAGLKQPIMVVTLSAGGMTKPREAIEAELKADMDAVNASLEPHEQIAKVIVAREPWSIDNGIMTPTMKVKRNEVEKKFTALLEQHANDYKTKVVWE